MTHSVSGVVCDLLRARVTAEKKLGGSQQCVCEGLTSLNRYFAKNRDTIHIRSRRACASVFISVETVTLWRAPDALDDQIRDIFVYLCHKRQKLFEGKSAITFIVIVRLQ